MANITVAVDSSTYRRARMAAAARNQSVSALVREYLQSLNPEKSAEEKNASLFATLDTARGYCAGSRLTREESHARRKSA